MASSESNPPTKICTACGLVKDLAEFSVRQDRGKPYRLPTCQACTSAYFRAYRATHREHLNTLAHRHNERSRAKHREAYLARTRQWRATHKAEVAAYNKAYEQAHQAERRNYRQEYERAHGVEVRARRRAYYQRVGAARQRQRLRLHPERFLLYVQKRRARLLAAPVNDFTPVQWREMQAAYAYRCAYCGTKQKRLTMDHITPLSKGGTHTKHNIVPACKSCNSQKQAGPVPQAVQPLLR